MMQIKNNSLWALSIFLALLTLLPCEVNAVPEDSFGINLWTNGIVPYKFDDGTLGPVTVHGDDQTKIECQMRVWEQALKITDPATGRYRNYIDFRECDNDCPDSYLIIRYNKLNDDGTEAECNNMSEPVGMELRGRRGSPDGITELHLRRGICPREAEERGVIPPIVQDRDRTNQSRRIVLHELGHVLGLWHEFNRTEADSWLVETPDLDGHDFEDSFGTKTDLMPALGNYDYDSIMHYGSGSLGAATSCSDYHRNTLDKSVQGAVVSERDKSRVLQYYARERYPKWGFFTSLSNSPADSDSLPNPQLAGGVLVEGVWAVGTPAIGFQSSGNFDIFARGSDNHLYWKSFHDNEPDDWISLGCCFGSDPSAVSPRAGEIDLVAIGASTGKLIHRHYENGVWGRANYVQGGYPTGGIKQAESGGYVGPAIASRRADSLDVFVVRSDGRLAGITLEQGAWGRWTTLRGEYNVTARPAAVALSATEVQLAINESDYNLYEPLLRSDQLPFFSLGILKGTTAYQAPPALTKRDGQIHRYRVLITNADGRISHRLAQGSWRDVGGIPKPGTGPSAVATNGFTFIAVMNGEDATGCDLSCSTDLDEAPNPDGALIQPGGLWIRHFD